MSTCVSNREAGRGAGNAGGSDYDPSIMAVRTLNEKGDINNSLGIKNKEESNKIQNFWVKDV